MALVVKNSPASARDEIWSLGQEDPLEESMVTHSDILAWRIPTDRGTWWATYSPWAHKESDTTEVSWHVCNKIMLKRIEYLQNPAYKGEPWKQVNKWAIDIVFLMQWLLGPWLWLVYWRTSKAKHEGWRTWSQFLMGPVFSGSLCTVQSQHGQHCMGSDITDLCSSLGHAVRLEPTYSGNVLPSQWGPLACMTFINRHMSWTLVL